MIRYVTTLVELKAEIETESPGWLAKAAQRTKTFRAKKKYAETSSIWSAVKAVYMRLQGDCKCAYCERKLESVRRGKGEQDVEHFRPKASIKAWKAPQALVTEGIKFGSVPAKGSGYYLLPYHPFNYAAACKPCNSALKRDFFPIGGKYKVTAADPAKLSKEQAYLLYPIGDIDVDPETVLQFYGLSPQPVQSSGFLRSRAVVTIEFFELDEASKRKNLFRERAMIITALFPQLENVAKGATAAERAAAQRLVDGYTSARAPHSNCARSFRRLYQQDPADAQVLFDKASAFITSIS